ncbi:MAG: prenyltransferase [Candidatus Bathyarchaeia archaeon]
MSVIAAVKRWVIILRAPFFQATYIPVALGAALAWSLFGVFDLFLLALTLAAAILLDGANHMLNDYWDFKSGTDLAVAHSNPFAGGGRALTMGLIDLSFHFRVALALLVIGVAAGLTLVALRGPFILILGVIGVFSLFFYVGPPVKLAHRGIGEIFVALNYGPLMVLGSYFVQTQRLDFQPIVASLPLALLIAAVLWINEFPDFEVDKTTRKFTLVVRLGLARSYKVLSTILILPYVVIILAVATGIAPPLTLVGLIGLPLALKALKHLSKTYENPNAMTPANAFVVLSHLITGIGLIAAFVGQGLIFA